MRLDKRFIDTEIGMIKYALKEFIQTGWLTSDYVFTDGTQGAMCVNILELLEVLGNQGHSGSTGSYTLALFNQLADYKPITPLQGTDDEWNDVGNDLYQNNRCSSVFKQGKNGIAYNMMGRTFSEYNGLNGNFLSFESDVYIEFPYIPKTEIIVFEGEFTKEKRQKYRDEEKRRYNEIKKRQEEKRDEVQRQHADINKHSSNN